jgi:ankyrin repeat protein
MIRDRFRWVFCQLEVLRYCFPNNLRRVLEELPKSLDDTYKRILKEINNANQVHAYRLLQCLTVARRPLRVEELAEVLAFDLSTKGIPKLNADWRWENQEEAVLSACSSLVSVIIKNGSRVVQFSHFSVKEFLTSDRLASCMESQFYIPVEHSHTILAQACLGVLLSLDDRTDQYSERNLPLYRYATAYWVQHTRIGNVELVIKDTLDQFFDTDKPHFSSWVLREFSWEFSTGPDDVDIDVPPSAPALYFAAWRGFHGLVERLLIKHPQQVHHLGGYYGTALHASVHGGHIEIAQLLVAHGAVINSSSARKSTPLHIASEKGHLKIVEWLLNHGADVNIKDGHGSIPLHFSAHGGHLEVCRMLLGHGAAVNTRGHTGSTPFLEAMKSGYTDVIWLLLHRNPDVNVRDSDDDDNTPLHHATRQGQFKFVDELLKRNAKVNSCNNKKHTPLFLASEYGHTNVLQLLLEHNADVNAHDNEGDTPLHLSAGWGQLEATQLLLEREANVKSRNNSRWTPLHRAAQPWNGQKSDIQIVQLLLDHGADVQACDSRGMTAAEIAVEREQHEMVRLLSQHAVE